MARITIEDCLAKEPNRFNLIRLAANRAQALSRGEASPLVSEDRDKSTVIALREIAGGLINLSSDTNALKQAEVLAALSTEMGSMEETAPFAPMEEVLTDQEAAVATADVVSDAQVNDTPTDEEAAT